MIAAREPIHVLYGGAHLFKADTAKKLGQLALRTFAAWTPTETALSTVFAVSSPGRVHARVKAKLEREAVEDLRIDFEDGYGVRSGDEEDSHADSVGRALAQGLNARSLPPFIGIRVKAMNDRCQSRARRTLERVFSALLHESRGVLPANFVVTLPKVSGPHEVSTLAHALSAIEHAFSLPPGCLHLELMIETPEALERGGQSTVPALIAASEGRCVALHFGAYDYLSALEVAASVQTLGHRLCDGARERLKLATAGTGVRLSDGATNVLPIEPHRGPAPFTGDAEADNRRVVEGALRLHAQAITHALSMGIYQGWDLHPAQLVARYVATFAFFLDNQAAAARRLAAFVSEEAKARVAGGIFDDAATARGLATFFLRGLRSGAFDDGDIAAAGTDLAALERYALGDFTPPAAATSATR